MGTKHQFAAAAVGLAAAFVSVACSDSPNSVATGPREAAVATTAAATPALPKIGHVFIVILENEDVLATYGPNSPATYLIDTLAPMGTFMSQYYGIGHASLDNYTAAVSGQAPDSSTSASFEASASNLFGAVTKGRPVSRATASANFSAKPAGALRPVPTAVPPWASI